MSKKSDLETTAKEEAVEQEFFARQAEKSAPEPEPQPEAAPESEKPPTPTVSTWRTSSTSEGDMTWEQFRNVKLTT
jgi:hypothetical protein